MNIFPWQSTSTPPLLNPVDHQRPAPSTAIKAINQQPTHFRPHHPINFPGPSADKPKAMAQVPARTDAPLSWQAHCGPLEALLQDPSVTEIMVNGTSRIFIEQKGVLKRSTFRFESAAELLKLMKAMAEAIGRTLSPESPYVDGRLPDGSRINCVIPPVAVDGPALTIRKFSREALTHQQLIASGAMDERMAYFLSVCVGARLNIVVSGGTGSGKTTLLNVLSNFIPPGDRVITIEDTAELKIQNENLVRLEARVATAGDAGISVRQLVVNALRMRPDRILVGESRGPEALDMLMAMNTGHEGSMTTLHSNSAREALRRLESMVLMAATEMPLKVIRQNISGALNLIIQVQRCPDGVRRVVEIIEIGGMEGDVILSQDIFKYTSTTGFTTTGFVPGFVRIFKERGLNFPPDFFTDRYTVAQVGQGGNHNSGQAKKKA